MSPALRAAPSPATGTNWRHRAACKDTNPDLFVGPDRETGRQQERRENRAKKICVTCPVTADCLRLAERLSIPYGVFGGLSEAERTAAKTAPAKEVAAA